MMLNSNLPYTGLNWRNISPSDWPKYQTSVQATVASTVVPNDFVQSSFITLYPELPDGTKYFIKKTLLLDNGNVLIFTEKQNPFYNVRDCQIFIYNTYNNFYYSVENFATIPNVNIDGSNNLFYAFSAVLLNNNKVFLTGTGTYNFFCACVLNLINKNVTFLSGYHDGNSWAGYKSSLLLDGRVLSVKFSSLQNDVGKIYNPQTGLVTNTVNLFSSYNQALNTENPTVLPNGKVIITNYPQNTSAMTLYDPNTNSVSFLSKSGGFDSGGYKTGIILKDGLVFFPSKSGSESLLFNYLTNSFTPVSTGPINKNGVLLPDGNIVFATLDDFGYRSNYSDNTRLIYNTTTNTFETIYPSFPTGNQIYGLTSLFDGRIFSIEYSSQEGTDPGGNFFFNMFGGGKGFDYNFILSPFSNKV